MRILVISNYYPPHHIGGYEIACAECVEHLRQSGHEVQVLTSDYKRSLSKPVEGVDRRLISYSRSGPDRLSIFFTELRNRFFLGRALKKCKPDIVYVWNLGSLSAAISTWLAAYKVVYFIFDEWFVERHFTDRWMGYWSSPARSPVARALKSLARRSFERLGFPTSMELFQRAHLQFAADYLRKKAAAEGLPVTSSTLIYWGVDLDKFPYVTRTEGLTKRVLYVGQVVPHKGVHTAIETLGLLVGRGHEVTLTIAGGSVQPEYIDRLREQITDLGIEERVAWAGFVGRDDLPQLYADHHIFLFPSEWNEPFGIVLLEAMASGMAVVSTARAGSAEIVEDNHNALVFESGNAAQAARMVERLMMDNTLFENMRLNARQTVETRFDLRKTLSSLESDALSHAD
jgi:glycosyltransferase involved in cell wall biosynthesis